MIKGFIYSYQNALRLSVLLIMVILASCSKPDDPTPIVVPPIIIPPSNIPTGVIDYFTIEDTLIGFNKFSIAKWLVSGTNNLSSVTFGGNSVGLSGSLSTGRIKKDSVFTLAINNGVQQSVLVKVADSITTLMHSDGKYAQKTKTEVLDYQGNWKDTTKFNTDERIFFGLNGSSTIIIISNPSPPDGGPFNVTIGPNRVPPTFTWRMVLYTVALIDSQFMIVTYQGATAAGQGTYRDTFTFN